MDGYTRPKSQTCSRPRPRPLLKSTLATTSFPPNPSWGVQLHQEAKIIGHGLARRRESHPRSVSQETCKRSRSAASHPRTHQSSDRIIGTTSPRTDLSATLSGPSVCDTAEGEVGSGKRRDQEAVEVHGQYHPTDTQWTTDPRYSRFWFSG